MRGVIHVPTGPQSRIAVIVDARATDVVLEPQTYREKLDAWLRTTDDPLTVPSTALKALADTLLSLAEGRPIADEGPFVGFDREPRNGIVRYLFACPRCRISVERYVSPHQLKTGGTELRAKLDAAAWEELSAVCPHLAWTSNVAGEDYL